MTQSTPAATTVESSEQAVKSSSSRRLRKESKTEWLHNLGHQKQRSETHREGCRQLPGVAVPNRQASRHLAKERLWVEGKAGGEQDDMAKRKEINRFQDGSTTDHFIGNSRFQPFRLGDRHFPAFWSKLTSQKGKCVWVHRERSHLLISSGHLDKGCPDCSTPGSRLSWPCGCQ